MSKLALGTVQFGTDYGINSGIKVDPNEVTNIINCARNNDISLLDTAQLYGSSEKVLGDINTQDFDIVTKSRGFYQEAITEKEAVFVINDLHKSLKLLKQKSLYAFLVHHGEDLLKPGGEMIFNQLQSLKKQGLVNKIGISAYIDNQLIEIIDRFDIDIIQLPMNILDWRWKIHEKKILKRKKRGSFIVHARSTLLQGLILSKKLSHWRRANINPVILKKITTWFKNSTLCIFEV